jgi:archaellum biogenesis ATPase FlaH
MAPSNTLQQSNTTILKEENMSFDSLNKSLDRLTKRLRREKNRNEILKRLSLVSKEMRNKGASERSIRIALLGTYEFLKVYLGETLGKSVESLLKHPEQVLEQDLESPGILLSDIETRQVDWLWERRIPLGKITILDGDPGMGKSLLAINVAACVSTGHAMPDGTLKRQGGVIVIAPEDSAEDTIKPRVEAAGGDPSRVLLLNTIDYVNVQDVKKVKLDERPFSLSHDLHVLEENIKKIQAVLVILDPLMAILGRNIDSSRDQNVREVFTPLAQLAERTGCAILIIRHLNKGNSDNILYRGAGSIGIIGAARIALLVAHDPEDEQKRVLATTKNNLSKMASNLTFQIVENERGVPHIQWLGENQYTPSALLRNGQNLSFERQEILRVLKSASDPLGAKEIAEQTGLKYESLRLMLSRMYKAGEIARPFLGMYTSLNHPSLAKKSVDVSGDTSETTATCDTTDTKSMSDFDPSEN